MLIFFTGIKNDQHLLVQLAIMYSAHTNWLSEKFLSLLKKFSCKKREIVLIF